MADYDLTHSPSLRITASTSEQSVTLDSRAKYIAANQGASDCYASTDGTAVETSDDGLGRITIPTGDSVVIAHASELRVKMASGTTIICVQRAGIG